MKIGILGGTFDPVHQGHLLLARAAQKQFSLAKVLFIPAFIPPHKTKRRDLTPAPYRYRMVEMAVGGEPGFEISDLELNRPDVSYTVDTLRALKKKYPGDDLFLIFGADTLAEVSGWREPAEIRRLAGFLAASRPAFGLPAALPGEVSWIDMPACPISSSAIREAVRQGRPLGKDFLPPAVEGYIRRMKLYGTDRPCR